MSRGPLREKFLRTVDLSPDGERIDFNRQQVRDETYEHLRQLTCEGCRQDGTLVPAGIAVGPQGSKLMGLCTTCGTMMETWYAVRSCFTLDFDNNAHSISWDTQRLLQLIAKLKIPPVPVPIDWVDALWEFNGENAVDSPKAKEYAMTRPLDEPILIVQHPSAMWEEPGFPLLCPIDGWHRIYKAHVERKPLMAFFADRALEQQARVRDVIYV